jgi:hypothetical protein
MNIKSVLSTKAGSIIISIILGLGLAAVFRKACKDNNCIVIKGPKMQEVNKYYYKINQDCFKYTPVAAECQL